MTKTAPLIISRQVAEELALSYQTLCAWSKQCKLPELRLPDGSYRYRRADIDAWLSSRENT
jgi:predicted site-specific integrase-resolvase